MPQDRGELRDVVWQEVFPWLCLFRAVLLAFDPRKVILAVAALILTTAGWWGLSYIFVGDAPGGYGRFPWQWMQEPARADDSLQDELGAFLGNRVRPEPAAPRDAALPAALHDSLAPFQELFRARITLPRLALATCCALWALAVWALFGGAITRIAAVQLAQEQRSSLTKSLRHALGKWRSYFSAPLFPFAFVILVVLLMALPGLLSRLEAGFAVVAVLWPIGLLFSLLMALLLVGLLFGWPLMWGTISAEGTDAFDALSRSYAYVYQRPFHYVFYAAVAVALGYAGLFVAAAFAEAVLYLGAWSMTWWTGPERAGDVFSALSLPPRPTSAGFGGAALVFWANAVSALVVAYGASYFWTSWTAIYFLLRRTTDATPMDVVYLEEQLDPRPLPRLKTDDAGVPVVDDSPEEDSAAEQSTEPDANGGAGESENGHD